VRQPLRRGAGQHAPEPAGMRRADDDEAGILALGELMQTVRGGRIAERVRLDRAHARDGRPQAFERAWLS
jgi:hypothetical protein